MKKTFAMNNFSSFLKAQHFCQKHNEGCQKHSEGGEWLI
jgi:hypothetical protein